MAALRTAWVAEVALNLYGIISLALHIFLRSNADRAVIQPLQSMGHDKKRLRFFGPSDLEMTMYTTSAVLLNDVEGRYEDGNHKIQAGKRTSSHTLTECSPCAAEAETNDAQHVDYIVEFVAQPSRPVRSPPQIYLSPGTPRQGSKYSIFPTFRSAMLRNSMSTTFSQEEDTKSLQPPKPLAPFNHKRELSEQTSATVQIGLRLSNMSDAQRSNLLSPTASSCCLPLQGTSRSIIDSPPISPLSARWETARITSQDTMDLPLQLPRDSHDEQFQEPKLEFCVPGREGQIQPRSQRKGDRPITMKALPPIPPTDSIVGLPGHPRPSPL
ncbi:MAG: hypothetical protein Q9224_003248 [Gallowayella concinna]